MSEEVKNYQPKEEFDPAKHDQYCELLKEHLQDKLKEEEDCMEKQWNDLAAETLQFLCGMTTTLL